MRKKPLHQRVRPIPAGLGLLALVASGLGSAADETAPVFTLVEVAEH